MFIAVYSWGKVFMKPKISIFDDKIFTDHPKDLLEIALIKLITRVKLPILHTRLRTRT